MLVHQAAAQLAAWTGLEPPVGAMWDAARLATGTADRG
jgi:shikimate 5-dehydrogenase